VRGRDREENDIGGVVKGEEVVKEKGENVSVRIESIIG
jgi:hypothetical protein